MARGRTFTSDELKYISERICNGDTLNNIAKYAHVHPDRLKSILQDNGFKKLANSFVSAATFQKARMYWNRFRRSDNVLVLHNVNGEKVVSRGFVIDKGLAVMEVLTDAGAIKITLHEVTRKVVKVKHAEEVRNG